MADVPAKPFSWRSTEEIARDFVGGHEEIRRRLQCVREALVGDVSEQWRCSHEQAAALVEDLLIGEKKPKRGRTALAASPDGVRLLGLPPRETQSPAKPSGWCSTTDLHRRGFRGRHDTLQQAILELREELVADVVAVGYPEEEAVALVEESLVGRKKPRGGQAGLAISPDGIRLGEATGRFVRRARGSSRGRSNER